ncbi:MAG: glycosyltransferase family 4 protein [Stellaceae bacterium]
MRIAFYAPLKSPDHPVPSGDRRLAQLFVAALRQAGHVPMLASRFRTFEGEGGERRQERLATIGQALAERLLRRWRSAPGSAPELWFTYHLHHKAPDWLGPHIAGTLGIPYVVAEASFAPKQAGGPWDRGHRAVAAAIGRADAVIGLNPADRDCVLPLLAAPSRWVAIKPFLDAGAYRTRPPAGDGRARLISVAMMRHGDKLASYRLLGAALQELTGLDWSLRVVGDGAARAEVARALEPLNGRVSWAGSLGPSALADELAAADLCVWPAVNEAFGMALLEAQASGLPVVAGADGGVGEVVADGRTGLLVPPRDVASFAAAVRRLLLDRELRARLATSARRRVLAEHDIGAAARRLGTVIAGLRPPNTVRLARSGTSARPVAETT